MAPNFTNFKRAVWEEYLSTQSARLPPLPVIQDVSDRVIRVMGGNAGLMQLQGTNTYLVGTGRSRILIDTGQGLPIWCDTLTRLLQDRDLDISHILLTHWHHDHTGGVPDLIAHNQEWASRVYKCNPDSGQNTIEDGQLFCTEGATFRAVFTPGHAFDHMCFVLEEENAIFTGDNVLGEGFTVVEDLGAYIKSLHYMKEQGCPSGYPAHGIVIDNMARKIDECIRHKTKREERVFAALKGHKAQLVRTGQNKKGGLTIREIIFVLHGPLQNEDIEMALEPFITEVLFKLAEDRKIGFEMNSGNRRWYVTQRVLTVDSKRGECQVHGDVKAWQS